MILTEIIDLLQKHHFKGAGEFTEFAKGKNEYITTFKDAFKKIKRILWQLKEK